MPTVEKSIEVNAPVSTVYNQWTQFEEFPKFMDGVREVHQIDDTRMVWHANIAGQDESWEAEVTEQIPDKRVAWRNKTGAVNAGVVTFHHIDEDKARVMLQMDYEPESIVESVGDKLGFMSRRVEGDLERFKELVESRGEETGGWRGQV
ncbi:MAG: SRPBCC family protein [Sphaerobacteraceae bacterium]|nr:MAG: SRPBCC family protein [Sphaerobacteraceae bacterium]